MEARVIVQKVRFLQIVDLIHIPSTLFPYLVTWALPVLISECSQDDSLSIAGYYKAPPSNLFSGDYKPNL